MGLKSREFRPRQKQATNKVKLVYAGHNFTAQRHLKASMPRSWSWSCLVIELLPWHLFSLKASVRERLGQKRAS